MTFPRRGPILAVLVLAACGDGGGNTSGDMSPPTTPTDLSAQLIAANTVDLTWSPSIDDVGVTGYRIFRDGNTIGTSPGASHVDDDAPLAEVCYTVAAYDAAGNQSGQSDPACLDLPRSWILRAGGVRTNLESVAWSGTRIAAVGSEGDDRQSFLISDDGAYWLPKHHQQFPGGPVIEYGGGQFVAFTDLGMYLSPDGQSGLLGGDDPWLGLDLAADMVWAGDELVAVGPGGRIFSSTDGRNWTEQTSNTTEMLSGVTSSGTQLVAVGDAATIVTSSDGVTWTAQQHGLGEGLQSVAWSGSRFLALGITDALTSTDGAAWVSQGAFPPGVATDVAGSPTLDLFAAVGWNGLIATSEDGMTWTERQVSTLAAFSDVIWAGDRFVAVGDLGVVVTSTDGVSWDLQSFGDHFLGVSWLGDRLAVVGAGGRLSTSTDGIEWSHGWTGDPSHIGNDIASSGSTYVIAGYMWLLSSPDLEAWTGFSLGIQECKAVIWTGTTFAAACGGSIVYTSANGTDWTANFVDGTFGTELNDIVWTGSQYVVVGEAGSIFTSPDGSAWTPRTSGDPDRLYAVAWSGQRLVACGSNGTLLTSTDGVSWSPVATDVTEPLYDVTWADTRFATAGGNESILVSPDGLTWEDRSPADSHPRMNGVASVDGKIVIVADDGHIFMSP